METRQPKNPARAISVHDARRTSLAENTRSAYRKGWRRFAAWCERLSLDPMQASPDQVAAFLVSMAGEPRSRRATTKRGEPLALATIRVTVAAINRTYRDRNRPSPVRDPDVANVLRGLSRLSTDRGRQVKALCANHVAGVLARCDELSRRDAARTRAARDAAIIAVGFAAALRRSEICALKVADVEFTGPAQGPDGMFLHIRRSKTDQAGKGQRIAVPEGERIRPVSRLRSWLQLAGIEHGPLFQTLRRGGHLQNRPLHPTDVARLVKRHVRAIGLDPTDYSGHSLRAGFVTSAAEAGARLDKIMEVTRHRSPGMVLRYIRQADAFRDHAGNGFL